MSEFDIQVTWRPEKGDSDLDATIADIRIEVGGRNVSAFRSDLIGDADHLHIPAYNLAEWIAENWWPLLWEPRKSEDFSEDPDFSLRHSFIAAGGGFPLPNVDLTSQGEKICVKAKSRRTQIEDLHFFQGAEKLISRKEVERVLFSFAQKTVSQLASRGVAATMLQELWALILETTPDSEFFCRCIGALGASPYVEDPPLEQLLEKIHGSLGDQLTFDLCLAASPENLAKLGDLAIAAKSASTDDKFMLDLKELKGFRLPADTAAPGWRRGRNAAMELRDFLKIKHNDPRGSDKVLEAVGLRFGAAAAEADLTEIRITGLLHHDDEQSAHLALLQKTPQQRRFAAARGIFAACDTKVTESRLITMAVTRDQQANRAFAAELTAPYEFIRSRMHAGKLNSRAIPDIAAELKIAPDVVYKQAMNNGAQFTKG